MKAKDLIEYHANGEHVTEINKTIDSLTYLYINAANEEEEEGIRKVKVLLAHMKERLTKENTQIYKKYLNK